MNASNAPKIFVLAACVIFYSTLPAEAKGVWSSVRSVGATLTGDSEAYKADEKATEDARAQGAAYAAERMAAETNQQTVQAFLAQNRKDALARQAEYEAEQTARKENEKAQEDAARTNRERLKAEKVAEQERVSSEVARAKDAEEKAWEEWKVFTVPFLAFLEQGTEPFEAYIKAIKSAASNEVAPSTRFSDILKKVDSPNPVAQRNEMAAICQDLPFLCAPDTASKIKDKIVPYYQNIEEKIFIKRTGGRSGSGQNLADFTLPRGILKEGPPPALDTVYSHSSAGGGYYAGFVALKVMQSTKAGILVRGETVCDIGCTPDKLLFIKTKRQYADNDLLSEGYYIYTGLAEYKTVLGVGAKVHSFEEIDDPKKDLFFY